MCDKKIFYQNVLSLTSIIKDWVKSGTSQYLWVFITKDCLVTFLTTEVPFYRLFIILYRFYIHHLFIYNFSLLSDLIYNSSNQLKSKWWTGFNHQFQWWWLNLMSQHFAISNQVNGTWEIINFSHHLSTIQTPMVLI